MVCVWGGMWWLTGYALGSKVLGDYPGRLVCGEEGDGHAEASVFQKKVLRTEMCGRPRDHLRGGAQEATGGGERGEARTRRC